MVALKWLTRAVKKKVLDDVPDWQKTDTCPKECDGDG
jgi:hypothetical protein